MGWLKNLKPGSGDCAVCDCPESVCAACCPTPSLKCETRSASKSKFSPCGALKEEDGLYYMTTVETFEGGWTKTTTYTQDPVTGACSSSWVCAGSGVYLKHDWISGDNGHADAYTEFSWSITTPACGISQEITDWYGSCQYIFEGIPGVSCSDTDGSDKSPGSACKTCYDLVLGGGSYPNTSYSGDKPSFVRTSIVYSDPWTAETTGHLESRTEDALPSWPATWGGSGCSAYRNLAPDESSLSIRDARFKFTTSTPVPTGKTLVIYYDRTFTPESGSPSTTSDSIEIAAGDTESAVIEVTHPGSDGTETLTMTSYECIDA